MLFFRPVQHRMYRSLLSRFVFTDTHMYSREPGFASFDVPWVSMDTLRLLLVSSRPTSAPDEKLAAPVLARGRRRTVHAHSQT